MIGESDVREGMAILQGMLEEVAPELARGEGLGDEDGTRATRHIAQQIGVDPEELDAIVNLFADNIMRALVEDGISPGVSGWAIFATGILLGYNRLDKQEDKP